MQITTIGLDLAKHWFQVHGVDANGRVVVRRRLWRSGVIPYFQSLEPCLVGIEACATAHHWARELTALGHRVKLMPPAYVKAYVKRNKNDAADAEAICEAVTRPSMRFVPGKGRRAAVGVDAASSAQSSGPATHDAGQCLARSHGRVRHHCAAGSAASRDPAKDNCSSTTAVPGTRALDPADDCGPAEWHNRPGASTMLFRYLTCRCCVSCGHLPSAFSSARAAA